MTKQDWRDLIEYAADSCGLQDTLVQTIYDQNPDIIDNGDATDIIIEHIESFLDDLALALHQNAP